MKIYARQVAPEYQESPISYLGDEMYRDVIFVGNRNCGSRNEELYDDVVNYFDAIGYCIDNHIDDDDEKEYCCFPSPLYKGEHTSDEISQWVGLLYQWLEPDKKVPYFTEEVICKAIALLTGQEYNHKIIQGCSQSCWQDIYFPSAEYSDEAIKRLEADYFNLGTEWIIHDDDCEPESPDDIDGYSQYCYSWDDEGIKGEIIGGICNHRVTEVVLYKHDGYTKSSKYTIA